MKVFAKTAVVTGGAGGIGASIASALVDAGANVVLADINYDEAAVVAERLRSGGARILAVRHDITDRTSWANLLEQVAKEFGGADILCNNAGLTLISSVADVDDDRWENIMRVNLYGMLYGCQAFIRHVRERGGGGHIVNTASTLGVATAPNVGVYATSKYAVVGLSETLRFELASVDIGVSVFCPGVIDTAFAQNSQRLLNIDGPVVSSSGSADTPARMDAAFVGPAVVEGIEANDFYIFTNPEYRAVFDARHKVLSSYLRKGAQPGYEEDVSRLGAAWFRAAGE